MTPVRPSCGHGGGGVTGGYGDQLTTNELPLTSRDGQRWPTIWLRSHLHVHRRPTGANHIRINSRVIGSSPDQLMQ